MTAQVVAGTGQVLLAVRGLTLLRIEWLRRRLHAIDPDGISASAVRGFTAALYEAGNAAEPIMLDPRVSGWCAEVSNLLDRGAATLLPDGHFLAACRMADVLTLSARVLGAKAHPGGRVPPSKVRADHAGQIRLLGTRLVVDCGTELAGLDVVVEVRQGRPETPEIPRARLIADPAPLPGLVVSCADPVDIGRCGSDPILRAPSPCVAVQRGTHEPRSTALPGIAVVPATASAQWRGANVAAAVAHLRSAAAGQTLLADPAADPPLAIGAIFDSGHLARLLTLFEHGSGCGDPVAEVASALDEIADWLNRADRLTGDGELARDRLADCGFSGTAPGPSRDRRRLAPTWQARWRSAGGQTRPDGPAALALPIGSACLADLLAQLGAPYGVEINTLTDGRTRADQTIDHLSLMSARDPERFAAIVGQLELLPPDPTRDLLASHVAYIREQFEAAARAYARLLAEFPYDIDLWRDFAFALRHLGEVDLNEVALFRLPDVVERACACQLELGPLDVLRAEPDRWRSAPEHVRLLVGLLEWMRDDPDHR